MGFSSSGSVKNIIMDSAHVYGKSGFPDFQSGFVLNFTEVSLSNVFVYKSEDIALFTLL